MTDTTGHKWWQGEIPAWVIPPTSLGELLDAHDIDIDIDDVPDEPYLAPEHRVELHASGIDDETIYLAGLHTENEQAVVARYLNWARPGDLGPCLIFPCVEPSSARAFAVRVKPSRPLVDAKGKVRKYESAKGTPPAVYYGPRASYEERYRCKEPLLWTEGEKKCLILDQLGYTTVGLTGVWNAHDPAKRPSWEFLDAIKRNVAIEGREHVIVFDSDSATNEDVLRAANTLTEMLRAAGASTVRFATPPAAPKGEKVGVDDYFMTAGAQAVHHLISSAPDITSTKKKALPALAKKGSAASVDAQGNRTTKSFSGNPERLDNLARIISAWGVLRYNERSQEQEWTSSPPWGEFVPDRDTYPRAVRDSDIPRLSVAMMNLDLGFDAPPSTQSLEKAVAIVAEQTCHDAVRDFLDQVRWDGVPRLESAANHYFGVTDSAYSRAVFSKWMMSAVARTYEPGCKVDHVMILEGEQGLGKSSALATLCGERWFSDDLPALDTKDSKEHLLGVWVVEFGELAALDRSATTALKAFVTRPADRFRHAYGRRTGNHPRRCVFAGSTNEKTYLRDDTGGRRWWPLACTKVDIEGLARDREQLWAEAVHRYRQGEPWHITDLAVIDQAKHEQEQRRQRDPWEVLIADFIRPLKSVTVNAIFEHLDIRSKERNKQIEQRITSLLRLLRWKTGGRMGTGARERFWVPEG